MAQTLEPGFEQDGYRFIGGDPKDQRNWESSSLRVGTVEDNFRYIGGNPANKNNWEDVSKPNVLNRIAEGGRNTKAFAEVGVADDPSKMAAVIAERERTKLPATDANKQILGEITKSAESLKKAEGVVDTTLATGSLIATTIKNLAANPKETVGLIAENLPNSLPGIAGSLGGAVAGGATAGPIGAVGGSVVGGTAGGYLIEQGASMYDQIVSEANKLGIDPRDAKALAPLIESKKAEFLDKARLKGIGTAGTDAVLNTLTLGLAGAAERTLVKTANQVGKQVADGSIDAAQGSAQLADIAAKNAARNTIGQKAIRGGAITGAEAVGEAASEYVGQKLAYGEVNPVDVALEGVLGAGQGVAMAGSRGLINKGAQRLGFDNFSDVDQAIKANTQVVEQSKQRAVEELGSATTVDNAIAAADKLAGSVSELSGVVDEYLVRDAALKNTLTPLNDKLSVDAPVTLRDQQLMIDRNSDAASLASTALTDFDRQSALDQAATALPAPKASKAAEFVDLTPMDQRQAVNRLTILRDMTANEGGDSLSLAIVAHPTQTGAFAIGRREIPNLDLPSTKPQVTSAEAQNRIEAAALVGAEKTRLEQDAPRQVIIDNAMRSVEERGGVASPAEAQIFREANLGQPYDSIDYGLAPAVSTDAKLTGATGIELVKQGTPIATADQVAAQNKAGAAELNARQEANQRGADARLQRSIESTSTAASAPNVDAVLSAMSTPGASRSAEQRNVVEQAQARMDAADFSILTKAAQSPATLSATDKIRLKDLQSGQAAPAPNAATNTDVGLGGTRVAERLGAPTAGRIVASDAKLSTSREELPGTTSTVQSDEASHSYTVVGQKDGGPTAPLLNQLARVFGKKVVLFKSDTLKADGFVRNEDSKTIYVNADSEMNPLAVFGHELMHLLKKDNPIAYAAIETVVKSKYGKDEEAAFKADYGQEADLEELSSDLLGNAFTDSDFLSAVFAEIANSAPEGQARGVIMRLSAAIDKAVKAALRVISTMPIGQKFKADGIVKNLDEIRAALKTALKDYAIAQKEPAMKMDVERLKAEGAIRLDGGQDAGVGVRQSNTRVRPNDFKATAADRQKAQAYFDENGIMPYLSEGQLQPPVQETGAKAKFSVKREGKYGIHPVLGIPVNKNGTVTLYYPTTNTGARDLVRSRKLVAANPTANRIYLTNESSAPKVALTPGNMDQALGGANVLVQVDPNLLQIDQVHEDGRKDFFIPIAEGAAFDKKMKQTKLFTLDAPRTKGLSKDQTITGITNGVAGAIEEYKAMTPAERRVRLKEARATLKSQHNIGTLLGENGKLEKTRLGDYGLTYEDKSVASLGLGLAAAQKINEGKLTTCPQSAICEALCLGETSGQNLLYGGDGQYRSGPRLSQYLKTEALVLNPEAFATVLFAEIDAFQNWANKTTEKVKDEATGKRVTADKEQYKATIRLNVTSDFPGKVFKSVIDAFPDVMFYDYTKLDGETVAPNHHLTYSSTGISQTVNGEFIYNKFSNWGQMVKRLNKGNNVAMAFTSRTDMPKFLVDEATGQKFQVWNGDNYDARFLDPKRNDGMGMIIGLTNKDKTTKPEDAAKKHNGFFVDYNAERDGETLVIGKENNPKEIGKTIPVAKMSTRRQTDTPEFKRWFGDSKVVGETGAPQLMYHGTANDLFTVFDKEKIRVNDYDTPFNGFWFSNDKQTSPAMRDAANVIPVYLSIKNPAPSNVWRKVAKDVNKESDEGNLTLSKGSRSEGDEVRNRLQAMGYDGIHYSGKPELNQNEFENNGYTSFKTLAGRSYTIARNDEIGGIDLYRGKVSEKPTYETEEHITGYLDLNDFLDTFEDEVWVAFEPNQIKSATSNNGAFDENNSDITKSTRRQIDTPEFKRWFGESTIVNQEGEPKVMYHGTARDITEFQPKQANAIFLTDNPRFAEMFSDMSANKRGQYQFEELPWDKQLATMKQVIKLAEDENIMGKARLDGVRDIVNQGELPEEFYYTSGLSDLIDYVLDASNGQNILPVYVRAEKPFDYENPDHVEEVAAYIKYPRPTDQSSLSTGAWSYIERPSTQQAIKDAGFDAFYVKENGNKNLAVYSSKQIKSATGNTGTFDKTSGDITKSNRRTPQEIQDGAKAIREMDEDTRDNANIADLPGGYQSYDLFEAQTLLPKPSQKLKKVTDDNSFNLASEVDYVANVDGQYFGVVKDEDPDDEDQTVYRYFRLDQPEIDYEPLTNDVQELFADMRKHLEPSGIKKSATRFVEDETGDKLSFPLFVDLVDKGYQLYSFENPRAYVNKGGVSYRTLEKDGARIALEPGQVLFTDPKYPNRQPQTGFGNENDVAWHFIGVDKTVRQQGKATQAIKDLIEVADKNQYTLYAEPAELEKSGMSKDQLVEFYGRFGFIPTNETAKVVVREPKQVKQSTRRNVLARDSRMEAAAQGLQTGDTSREDYESIVNEVKPVTPYESVPKAATVAEMRDALTSDKVERIGEPMKVLEAGDPVGLRLDIPAYANHGTWVVAVHEQQAGYAAGKSIGYESVAAAKNATFGVVEKAAANIAAGKPKATIAVVKGEWEPITPAQAEKRSALAMKSKNWTQVGMDPTRHSYFYDRASMEPVVSADEVIQIGPLVMAKNPVYGKKEDFLFSKRRPRENIYGNPLTGKIDVPEVTKFDNFLRVIQNNQIDIKRVVDALQKDGKELRDDANPYLQEELFHGRAATNTQTFIKKELEPLIKEMQMRKVSISDFEEYLLNRHAEERNEYNASVNEAYQDAGSGVATADARAYLASLSPQKRKTYEALAGRIDAITRGTREIYVESGIEKAEDIAAMENRYKYYVPLQREKADFFSPGGMGGGRGYDVRGASYKRSAGSDLKVVDIIANIALAREAAISRAGKVQVSNAAYSLALSNPDPSFWLTLDPKALARGEEALFAEFTKMGLPTDVAQNIAKEPISSHTDPKTGKVTYRTNPLLRNAPNVYATRINGEDRFIIFNQNNKRALQMVNALKNNDAQEMAALLKAASNFTRWFAQVNTQYNPIFGVVNGFRDLQGAALNLTGTPLAGSRADIVKGAGAALGSIYKSERAKRDNSPAPDTEWGKLWVEFQEAGGRTGYRQSWESSEDRTKDILNALDPGRLFGKEVAKGDKAKARIEMAKNFSKATVRWLEDFNTMVENAVRLSAYREGLAKGLSKDNAASLAKNITVNFNRKGQVSSNVGAMYAFFNAAVQGTARLSQVLFEMKRPGDLSSVRLSKAGKVILGGGVMLGSMQALLLAAAGFDEKEPPEFVRERNFIIPTGVGKKYVTIPMPLGYNVIPNFGRIATEWALSGFENTPKRVESLLGTLLDSFNPIGNAGVSYQTLAPTIGDPIVALLENKDWTGKTIAKQDFGNVETPGHSRGKPSATGAATAVAKGLNYISGGDEYKAGLVSPTPDQLEYVVGQLTGGVGREVVKLVKTGEALNSGDDLPPHKIPLVGRFYGDAEGPSAELGRYYENMRVLNTHEAAIKRMREDRFPTQEYYKENPEVRLISMAGDINRQVRDLQKQKEKLIEKDAPKESVRLKNEQIVRRMKVLNDRMRAIEENDR